MKKNIIFYLLGLALIGVSFLSCVDERDFDFERMTPIPINSNIHVNKLISAEVKLSDFFNIDSLEGLDLNLMHDAGGDYLEFSFSFDTILKPEVPNIEINPKNLALPTLNLGGTSYVGNIYYPELSQNMASTSVDFPELENQQRVDSLSFIEGSMNISVNSNINYPAYMIIKSNSIKNKSNNSTYIDTIDLSPSKRKGIGQNTINLSNYKMVVNQNKLLFEYRLCIMANGALLDYNVSLNFSFNNLKYDVIYGVMGSAPSDFSNTIDIPFFKSSDISQIFEGGHFSLEKLFVNFITETNNGIPATINLTKLGVYDKEDNFHNIVTDESQRLLTVIPASNPNSIGTNTKNVNFDVNLLNLPPQKISHGGTLTLNPNKVNCFLVNEPYINVKAELHIPFKGKLNDLDYETSFYNDLYGENQDAETYANYISSATIYLDLTNYFPISIGAELYGIDTNGNEIGKILNINNGDDNILINGANVDNNGNILTPVSKKTTIHANRTNVDILKRSKKLKIKLKLNSSSVNNVKPFIRFQKEFKIVVNAGVDLNISTTINPFNN
jgi:hypothetical protein